MCPHTQSVKEDHILFSNWETEGMMGYTPAGVVSCSTEYNFPNVACIYGEATTETQTVRQRQDA